MRWFLMLGSIAAPILLLVLQNFWPRLRLFFHLAALLSALLFGNIASLAIYTIIKDKTVFMTNIHALFLNPLFLLTGAYLGVYFLYIIMQKILKDWHV